MIQYIFSAPGRTEISGNHTDHQHGCVLAASVNLKTTARVTLNDDGVIRIQSEGYAPVEVVKELTAIVGVSADETSGTAGFYTIAGQRVSHPSKGLYIVNGKKVFIK